MNFCPTCGTSIGEPSRFCMSCGSVLVGAASALSAPAPAVAPAQLSWQQQLPGPFSSIPPELLLVCGLMAAAGGLTLWPVIRVLPDIVTLVGAGGFETDLGLLLLTVWVVLGLFGSACLLLAWRLAHADRVARGLAYVL